jgi:hypothetical protein
MAAEGAGDAFNAPLRRMRRRERSVLLHNQTSLPLQFAVGVRPPSVACRPAPPSAAAAPALEGSGAGFAARDAEAAEAAYAAALAETLAARITAAVKAVVPDGVPDTAEEREAALGAALQVQVRQHENWGGGGKLRALYVGPSGSLFSAR